MNSSLNSQTNSLSYVRPVLVAYVRMMGPIEQAAAEAWSALRSVPGLDIAAGYGLIHGSLCKPHDMFYDACVELPDDASGLLDGSLATQTIAGGVHIASDPVSSHKLLMGTLSALTRDPLIGHGLTIAAERPAIVTYVRSPSARSQWTLSLNMPLCWSHEAQGKAA